MRIACLASGHGTNLQAIIDAIEGKTLEARIVAVITNVPGTYALERAKKHGLPAFEVDHRRYDSRKDFEQAVISILDEQGAQLVCLCGFMRILSPLFIGHFACRIMNIHPALLPAFGGKGFYGEKVHQAVLESGAKFSGCTVHFVDEQPDHGPIIMQRVVPVLDDDTPQSLALRVLQEEHRAYVEAIVLFAAGRLSVSGRRVAVKPQ